MLLSAAERLRDCLISAAGFLTESRRSLAAVRQPRRTQIELQQEEERTMVFGNQKVLFIPQLLPNRRRTTSITE